MIGAEIETFDLPAIRELIASIASHSRSTWRRVSRRWPNIGIFTLAAFLRHHFLTNQISNCDPSSTTRLVGSLKNAIGLSALRTIHANRRSRQIAMPGRAEGTSVSRLRK